MKQAPQQSLRFGPIAIDADNTKPAAYYISGRRMYAIGMTSGAIEPVGVEHLVGEMGGVWAHPVKFLEGWFLSIHDSTGRRDLMRCDAFEGHLSDITMRFSHGPLRLTRTDVIADDEAALFALVEVVNEGDQPWSGTIGCVALINILGTWFSGWECGGAEVQEDRGRAIARDRLWQGRWGVVFGSPARSGNIRFGSHDRFQTAEAQHDLTLQPGERISLEFLATCDHQNGHAAAMQVFDRMSGHGRELLDRKRDRYSQAVLEGVTLRTPDEQINNDWLLAKANLLMLEADYTPYLPGYLLAGIPEYPNLFSCDNTYTTPGATAAGFAPIMRSTLEVLCNYARRACGRVPHEVTTNGRVFNPGNTQETPQFAIAVWDYVRWTGDTVFMQMAYPVCREGMMEYLPSVWDPDGDGYPSGDAMVERHGMGSLKLDSACYLYEAWRVLAEMARLLERPEAAEYDRRANDWLQRFERDWWMPEEGLYADSLHSDYRPQLDGHWTQVVPVQLGIARSDRAEQVLGTIEREFTNQWGLVHTRDREERVWTLPTGLLVLAQLRYGHTRHALRLLNNIALTARQGMLGALKELIPEGLCFVQLWSSGLYLQCILEGILGLDPHALEHRLTIAPALPSEWPSATVERLCVGSHTLTITATQNGGTIVHTAGTEPLRVRYKLRGTAVAEFHILGHAPVPAIHHQHADGDMIEFTIEVGRRVEVQHGNGRASVTYLDHPAEAGTS